MSPSVGQSVHQSHLLFLASIGSFSLMHAWLAFSITATTMPTCMQVGNCIFALLLNRCYLHPLLHAVVCTICAHICMFLFAYHRSCLCAHLFSLFFSWLILPSNKISINGSLTHSFMFRVCSRQVNICIFVELYEIFLDSFCTCNTQGQSLCSVYSSAIKLLSLSKRFK